MTSEQLSAQIGRWLAEWRQRRNFRPETFARRLGMTPRAYLAWEQASAMLGRSS
jgi:transcriptional regulator with XRE-family HTH domain